MVFSCSLAVQSMQGVPVPMRAVRQIPGAEAEPPRKRRSFQGLDLRGRHEGSYTGGGERYQGDEISLTESTHFIQSPGLSLALPRTSSHSSCSSHLIVTEDARPVRHRRHICAELKPSRIHGHAPAGVGDHRRCGRGTVQPSSSASWDDGIAYDRSPATTESLTKSPTFPPWMSLRSGSLAAPPCRFGPALC